jgi:ferritin-like metal-binding protein YciE
MEEVRTAVAEDGIPHSVSFLPTFPMATAQNKKTAKKKKLTSLHDLLVHELHDLYDAEHRILKALPKMEKKATHEELAEGFALHFKQTEGHVKRLEKAFKLLGEKPKKETCDAMKGLVEEGSKALTEPMEDDVRDAAIIAAAQRVEHYEMAGYGSARSFAALMGHDEVADLLQATLEEEAETDKKLSEIAERVVNRDALALMA